MLRKLLLATAFALFAAAVPAAAQFTRPAPPPVRQPPPYFPPGTGTSGGRVSLDGPYQSTRSVSGEVWRVNTDQGYVDVLVPKRGMGRFYVGEKTRLRADKETPLGEKKKLTLEDFQKGQAVKVIFWPGSYKVTELRARRPKD